MFVEYEPEKERLVLIELDESFEAEFVPVFEGVDVAFGVDVEEICFVPGHEK